MQRVCSAGITVVVALALVAGPPCAAAAGSVNLVASICADGDLDPLGKEYAQTLVEAARDNGWSLAVQLDNQDAPPMRTLVKDGVQIACAAPPEQANSGSPEALTDLLRWASSHLTEQRWAVVIYGHGTSASGRTGGGTDLGAWPALTVDRSAGGDALSPAELSAAIADGLDRPVEVIVLDCCYGASMQALWDLREAADIVIASPGRLRSTGLAWDRMLSGSGNTSQAEGVARKWAEVAGQPMTVVRTAELERVRQNVERLCDVAAGRMSEVATRLTGARSECRSWGSEGEMCDLRALCSAIDDGGADPVAEAAAGVVDAVDAALMEPSSRAGRGAVTISFPSGFGRAAPIIATEGFENASRWGQMMRVYRHRLRELMNRTYNRRHDGAAT